MKLEVGLQVKGMETDSDLMQMGGCLFSRAEAQTHTFAPTGLIHQSCDSPLAQTYGDSTLAFTSMIKQFASGSHQKYPI